jgi:hypothetical protein
VGIKFGEVPIDVEHPALKPFFPDSEEAAEPGKHSDLFVGLLPVAMVVCSNVTGIALGNVDNQAVEMTPILIHERWGEKWLSSMKG